MFITHAVTLDLVGYYGVLSAVRGVLQDALHAAFITAIGSMPLNAVVVYSYLLTWLLAGNTMVTLYEPEPRLVAVVVTVNGATAVATADCTSVCTAVSLPGAVAKTAVKTTVACSVLPVCRRRLRLGLGAGARPPFRGRTATVTAEVLPT